MNEALQIFSGYGYIRDVFAIWLPRLVTFWNHVSDHCRLWFKFMACGRARCRALLRKARTAYSQTDWLFFCIILLRRQLWRPTACRTQPPGPCLFPTFPAAHHPSIIFTYWVTHCIGLLFYAPFLYPAYFSTIVPLTHASIVFLLDPICCRLLAEGPNKSMW